MVGGEGDSKSGEGDFMGVRFPLPAPSNLFVCNMLQGRELSEAILRYKYGTLRIQFIFNTLRFSKYGLGAAIYIYLCPYIRSITECAADNRSAKSSTSRGHLRRLVSNEELQSRCRLDRYDTSICDCSLDLALRLDEQI